MAVQAGKDLLVKVDMTSDGQFETIAGLRAKRVSFNAETVDVTSLDSSGGWRELLAGAGVRLPVQSTFSSSPERAVHSGTTAKGFQCKSYPNSAHRSPSFKALGAFGNRMA